MLGTPIHPASEHAEILEVVRRAQWATDIIITHRPQLEDAKAALDAYVAGRTGKVVFNFGSAAS